MKVNKVTDYLTEFEGSPYEDSLFDVTVQSGEINSRLTVAESKRAEQQQNVSPT